VTTGKNERITARTINDTIRYTCWTVYRRTGALPPQDAQAELESVIANLENLDVVIRGFYDVSAFRSDADLMVWIHAPSAELLQQALQQLRRSGLGIAMEATWSSMGLHRPAEFNRVTSRRLWRVKIRWSGQRFIHSCAPSSGTYCPMRNGGQCWLSTE